VTRLKVAALVAGKPGPHELWTLRRLAPACELRVVQAARTEAPRSLSAAVVSALAALDRGLLEELFDYDDLLAWWAGSGISPVKVPALEHDDARAALSSLSPDVIVRLSGGEPATDLSRLARLAALHIRHGHVPRGIVEGRRDSIGASVSLVDGTALWRGGPQLAPGDTHVDLFFRAHLEATSALGRILEAYARGDAPPPAAGEPAAHGAAAGLREWIKLLYLDQGRRARVLVERGLRC
jgi:hypothetical protein